MDESFVDAFRACAGDKDPDVRQEVARTPGQVHRYFEGRPWGGGVVDILLRLSKDQDPEVRYDAVVSGLTPLPETRHEDVIRRLVELAVVDRRPHLIQRIAWALKHETRSRRRGSWMASCAVPTPRGPRPLGPSTRS